MATIRANYVTDAAGTGSPNFPNGLSVASPALTGTPTAPTAAVGTNTTQVATTAFVSANLGVTENENRIINGAFDFWQRGTSNTVSGAYVADRWQNFSSGGTVTSSRQSFTLGDTLGSNSPTYFSRQNVTGQTLASHVANTVQKIEGVRSYAGQTITVLGWAKRFSGTGNIAVECSQSFGTGGSPSADVTAISPTIVTLTTSWTPFAVTMVIPSITGKTLGTSGTDYLILGFWTSAGSDYNARTNSLGLQTIGVDLWGIHIKVGTHTTAATDLYKQPEMGPELARCYRYFYKSADIYVTALILSTAITQVGYPSAMRAIPAVSGGGSGFTTVLNNTTVGVFYQTTTASTTLSFDAEL